MVVERPCHGMAGRLGSTPQDCLHDTFLVNSVHFLRSVPSVSMILLSEHSTSYKEVGEREVRIRALTDANLWAWAKASLA